MIFCGGDPGLTGAFAFRDAEKRKLLKVHDIPVVDGEVDGAQLAELLRITENQYGGVPVLTVIEEQQAFPSKMVLKGGKLVRSGPSSVAVHTAGKNYGILLGVLAARGWSVHRERSNVWKKRLQVPKDKNAARLRASGLMPEGAAWWPLVKHDGRAEAGLLALYAELYHQGRGFEVAA